MELWIARDKDGELFLYEDKPYLHNNIFYSSSCNGSIRLKRNLFPEVTFESGPKQVELKLIDK